MNILKIKNDKFLKKMNNKELTILSNDIRSFLIDNISKTGGHLSSNLGVVELSIMLHKVFNYPKDKIIFDVSHQSYVHKILTGRSPMFNTLRQYNGLSGFQKISEGDSYEAGHSSTSLSAALGFAIARDKLKKDYNIIAVIGDGSISNGLSYEALNQIGTLPNKVIIILNDNNMSISKNVGALHNYLDKIRSKNKYINAKDNTKKILNKIPILGKYLVELLHNIKTSLKKLYIKDGFLFEELGINYYGPINGHDLEELELYLTEAKKSKKSVLIHVITEKGKGYKYAENDKTGVWHGVGPFNKETGTFLNNNINPTWSEVITDSLNRLYNDKLILITPAMESGSKLTPFKEKHPNNFIDVGIAEEHSIVLANALSMEGLTPFVSIYSTFLQRAYDEVLHDVCRMNNHVILGIDRCGIVGEDGDTHEGVFDIPFLISIPNIIITSPKDAPESVNLVKTSLETNSPFAIRYSKSRIPYTKEEINSIPLGSWEQINKGKDLTLITYSDFVNESIDTINKLKEEGINVELVNARFIKPIDYNYFKKILKKNTPIIVYEESMEIGSLGTYLKSISNQNITLMGIKDTFIPSGKRSEILKLLNLDQDSLYKKIKEEVKNAKIRN